MLEQFTLVRRHGSKDWTVLHDCDAARSEHRATFKKARGSGHKHPEYADIKLARVTRKLRLDPVRQTPQKVPSANGHPAAPVQPKLESIVPAKEQTPDSKPAPKKRGRPAKKAASSLASRLLGT